MSKSQPPPSTSAADHDADPQVSASALDFLLIELVPLAQRISERVRARERAVADEYERSKILHGGVTAPTPATSAAAAATGADGKSKDEYATTAAGGGGGGDEEGGAPLTCLGLPRIDDDAREAVFWRLDGQGYRVGQGLVERFSQHKPRPQTALDGIKFICKDVWQVAFRKPIDNLKTNHRGVFVLTDNRFAPLSRMSVDRRAGAHAAEEAMARAQMYLYFPCGVIRGALSGLGIEASVTADLSEIPAATFQIKTKGAKA